MSHETTHAFRTTNLPVTFLSQTSTVENNRHSTVNRGLHVDEVSVSGWDRISLNRSPIGIEHQAHVLSGNDPLLTNRSPEAILQVSDISKYGDVTEVGQLILPRGPKEMISSSARTIQQRPIDTKTPGGVITLPDVMIYKYGWSDV